MKNSILGLTSDLRYFLYNNTVNISGGVEKFKGLVLNDLEMDPMDGSVYIFVSNDRKTLKILYYENHVFTLYTRKIYGGKFWCPRVEMDTLSYKMEWSRLRRLVNGYAVREAEKRLVEH